MTNLINRIKTHQDLTPFICKQCLEEGVEAAVHEDVEERDFAIIKVDDYYNDLNLERTPASVDCLITVKCHGAGYGVCIVELKSIRKGKRFDLENMKEKFETCMFDFMNNRYRNLFRRDYNRIDLYFVSEIELHKRDLGLKMEALMDVKFKAFGKTLMISPKMPVPVVKRCY